jgi:hypothetical protein
MTLGAVQDEVIEKLGMDGRTKQRLGLQFSLYWILIRIPKPYYGFRSFGETVGYGESHCNDEGMQGKGVFYRKTFSGHGIPKLIPIKVTNS